MGSYEDQLYDLAYGDSWNMTELGNLIKAVEQQQEKIQSVLQSLPSHWKGLTSDTLQARLKVHHKNLGHLKTRLYKGQQQVTGNGESMCVATCDNTDRIERARAAYESLPSTIVPASVLDQIKQGAEVVEVATVGPVDVAAKGVGWIADKLLGNREEAARKAVNEIDGYVKQRAAVLQAIPVQFDPLPVAPPATTSPSSMQTVPSRGIVPGGGIGPGGGTAPGGGGGGGVMPPVVAKPKVPGGVGAPLPGPPPTGPRNPVPNPNDPNYPNRPWDPNDPNYPGGNYDPNGPYDPNNPNGPYAPSGPNYPGGAYDPSRPGGPSADSSMDDGQSSLGIRSGLGAAGLGGVGLAAGAKLAGGAGGGAGGLGGLGGVGGLGAGGMGAGGVGPGGAGGAGGLAGTTGGAGQGSGGSNTGSGGAKGSGAAGRPGMMMGGQGGSNDKKSGPNKLGYVAAKFEDDYEENMPHPSARAGKRGE